MPFSIETYRNCDFPVGFTSMDPPLERERQRERQRERRRPSNRHKDIVIHIE